MLLTERVKKRRTEEAEARKLKKEKKHHEVWEDEEKERLIEGSVNEGVRRSLKNLRLYVFVRERETNKPSHMQRLGWYSEAKERNKGDNMKAREREKQAGREDKSGRQGLY